MSKEEVKVKKKGTEGSETGREERITEDTERRRVKGGQGQNEG